MSKLLYRLTTYIIYIYIVKGARLLPHRLFKLADNIAAYLEQTGRVSEEYADYLLDKRHS